jgi:hypothetical protein
VAPKVAGSSPLGPPLNSKRILEAFVLEEQIYTQCLAPEPECVPQLPHNSLRE